MPWHLLLQVQSIVLKSNHLQGALPDVGLNAAQVSQLELLACSKVFVEETGPQLPSLKQYRSKLLKQKLQVDLVTICAEL